MESSAVDSGSVGSLGDRGAASSYAISTLSVEVVEYAVVDDPNYYQHHVFTMQIWIEQDMIKLTRSYAAFVELDARLRRTFPRSDLPSLPLAGASSSSGKSSSSKRFSILGSTSSNTGGSTGGGNERDSMLHRPSDIRSSIIADPSAASSSSATGSSTTNEPKSSKKKLMKRTDQKEVISQKKNALTYYLTDLLRVPEVLMSDVLLYFLDEDAPDGEMVEDLPDEIMEIYELHMLLKDEPFHSKTVRKDHKVPLNLDAGSVVMWCFYTKLHDIGFCLHQDDKELLTYQRYNSHEKRVTGCFEVRQDCKMDLVWDNSYSKFRSKQLEYIVKVCTQETYELMKATAQEVKNMKRNTMIRRNKMKRVLQKLSNELVAEMHPQHKTLTIDENSSEVDVNHTEVEAAISRQDIDSKYFLEQLQKLQNEKKSLQLAYSECEIALVAERSACAKMQQQCDDLQLAKDLLEEENLELKTELESVRNDYYDLAHHTSSGNNSSSNTVGSVTSADPSYKYSIDDLLVMNDVTTVQSPEFALANFESLFSFAKNLHLKYQQLEETFKQQETLANKWKQEKKQLKTVAIQFKDKSEVLEHEKSMIVAQCEEFHQNWKSSEALCKSYEAEIEELKKLNARQEVVIAAAKMREIKWEEDQAAAQQSSNNVPIQATTSTDSNQNQMETDSNQGGSSFSFLPLSRGGSFVSLGEISPKRASFSVIGGSNESSGISSSFSSSSMLKKLFEAAGTTSNASVSSSSPTPSANGIAMVDDQLTIEAPSDENPLKEGSGHGYEEGNMGEYPDSPDQYKKMIVHDFAKVEADEISQYLTKATSSLMEMMPTWDSLLGINEEPNRQTSTNSSHSSNSNQATELTTFSVRSGLTADGSPVPEPEDTSTVASNEALAAIASTQTPPAAAQGNNKSSKSRNGSMSGIPTPFTTNTFRNMTFGF